MLTQSSQRTTRCGEIDLLKVDPVAVGYRPVGNEDPLMNEVENCFQALAVAAGKGLLTKEHLCGKVVDFGCGIGGSTWVLSANGADVVGVDARVHIGGWRQQPSWKDERALAAFGDLKKPDSCKILIQDGIHYLSSLPADSLDMVTAIMLGPDHSTDSSFVRQFLQAAEKPLKKGGLLLVFSDQGTVSFMSDNFPGADLCTNNIWARIRGETKLTTGSS